MSDERNYWIVAVESDLCDYLFVERTKDDAERVFQAMKDSPYRKWLRVFLAKTVVVFEMSEEVPDGA